MSSSTDVTLQFSAELKKVPGILSVTPTAVAWVPNVPGTMDRQSQNLNRAIAMFASKPTSPRISLKITFKDDIPSGGLTFTFTSPTSSSDRTAVQDHLIPYITANRAASAPTPAGPSTPLTGSTPGTPSAVAKGKRKADGTPDAPVRTQGLEFKIRRRVLEKNPNLKLLHRELVLGGQIQEEEFWDGREALLHAEEMEYAQRPGRPSRLLDDLKKVESGPVVLNITKELTREIFEEFPVVQDAYAKFVPGVSISEAEFWSRYFTSQLWEQHRASVRKSTAEEGAKRRDPIFDQYLEEPDWDAQPKHAPSDQIERFLDLSATEEDHGEAITVRDVTMQAGRERSSLPLMRRFNDHSQKLLRAGRDPSRLSESTLPEDVNIYNEIDLEDLHSPAASGTITLRVRDEPNRKDGKEKGLLPGKTPEELASLAQIETRRILNWTPDLSSVSLQPPAGGWQANRLASTSTGDEAQQAEAYEKYAAQRDGQSAAIQVVKDMYVASNLERVELPPIPDELLHQIRSCHNAATEFLRQYYSATLPNPSNPNLTPAAVSARSTRATKMAQYLRGTEAKVNAVVHTAQIAGVDPERVRAVMSCTVGAVRLALVREERRKGFS
ncbi:hypothetical protein M231_02797 [Tremella mesenterica]|uniref:BSD domain-containing protein n=1 Tax=Tremella mesenterica TaxID=5217 RepID=A0A4Q1BPQ9_TREME|nr:hypothetical protein M231_02797 [Tremella mesenterica]